MTPLPPKKRNDRYDPTDSQSGECETDSRPLRRSEFSTRRVNESTEVID